MPSRKNRKIGLFFTFVVLFYLVMSVLINECTRLYLLNDYNNTPFKKNSVFFHVDADDVILDKNLEYIFQKCVLIHLDGHYDKYEVLYCDAGIIDLEEGSIPGNLQQWALAGENNGREIGQKVLVNGKEYVVCGIVKKHLSEAVNNSVFYGRDSCPVLKTDESYVITSPNDKDIEKAYHRLKDELSEKNISVKRINMRYAEFQDFVDYEKQFFFWTSFLLLYVLLCLLAFWCIWLLIHKQEIKILYILGCEHIWLCITVKYLFVWFLACLTNLMISIKIMNNIWWPRIFMMGHMLVLLSAIIVLGIDMSIRKIIKAHNLCRKINRRIT
ncbi:MAG: hypothetical protein K5678_05830 [Acetatifactor sp.]|nr:hypothetical protein [Acetatifactor sp.]